MFGTQESLYISLSLYFSSFTYFYFLSKLIFEVCPQGLTLTWGEPRRNHRDRHKEKKVESWCFCLSCYTHLFIPEHSEYPWPWDAIFFFFCLEEYSRGCLNLTSHLSLHPDSTWNYRKHISDVDSGGQAGHVSSWCIGYTLKRKVKKDWPEPDCITSNPSYPLSHTWIPVPLNPAPAQSPAPTRCLVIFYSLWHFKVIFGTCNNQEYSGSLNYSVFSSQALRTKQNDFFHRKVSETVERNYSSRLCS